MFIPYTVPSSEKDRNTRRMINTHVAANASVKRRSCKKAINDGSQESTEFTKGLNWFHIQSHPTTTPSHNQQQESATDEEKTLEHTASDLVVAREFCCPSFSGGRFYPIKDQGSDSRGQLFLNALSYYFDVLLPYDSKVAGLNNAERYGYAAKLLDRVLQYKEVLHSRAAFSLCILHHNNGSRLVHQAILSHRQHTLKALRQKLSSQQVDDALLDSLCTMISVDEYLGFSEYRAVHLKGLQDIMQVRKTRNANQQLTLSPAPMPTAEESAITMVVNMNRLMVEFHLQMNVGFYRKMATIPTPTPETLARFSDPALEMRAMNLPPGFRDLICSALLTANILNLLDDFAAWFFKGMGTEAAYRETWRYSYFEPANGLENCISTALVCLADDLSALGSHPCAVISGRRTNVQRC
ncbi:conserved hypothetical protein [Talaromyces stipitatus ATCC 10500]|uniref:Uncharacterized protein n=1 Tax=Talaromyces stipitatus (strain ATCC 10500 / CBS 375.48 / QM 6759 / NRRL 1006) TaxID=441959 RepID=B8LTV4_TALSN|nr:uncharacterized protein TSTA_071800 [Talaromyces stipitatus ATCC 10500]EED23784.1 conserved hypothetical protein [Talaromyces stipitatus ATCC 10500]